MKNRIPTTSSWWSPTLRYPNWLTLDSTELSVALATSTGIQASDANDLYWVERRSAADIRQLLVVAARDNISAVTGLIDLASAHVRRLSTLFQTDEALILENELVLTIWSCIYDKPNPLGDDGVQLTPQGDDGIRPSPPGDDRDFLGGWDRVIAAERSVVLLTNARIGLVIAAKRIARSDIAALVEQAFDERGAHQLMDIARPVRKLIEEILERVDLEKQAEGQRVTPSWWLRHQVARTLLAHFLAARNAIQHRVSLRTTQAVQDAMERGEWRIAATIGLASLELDNKFRTHLPAINAVAAALENLRARPSTIRDGRSRQKSRWSPMQTAAMAASPARRLHAQTQGPTARSHAARLVRTDSHGAVRCGL